ncbi:translation initiation factor IF-2 [bacterium BMS3Abin07]|nr:translation initiation factor IF-2 [bacterium BMS3Abin07]GBE32853.1 translation initiation factor IF-2 [bacterium BMS3Bbin05]HDO22399.1 translation initiation factor IF-2 [Nitrospirota bacterium]HDZ88819.1 translation initiation factor IF-2 [Nitrospirota bacterium]
MSKKMRVHELAKELGKESKDVINALDSLGIEGKKAVSSLSREEVEKVKSSFKPVKKVKKVSKAKKKVVEPKEAAGTGKTIKSRKTAEVAKPEAGGKPLRAGEKIRQDILPELKKAEKKGKVKKKLKMPRPKKELIVLPETSDEDVDVAIALPDRFKKDIESEKDDKAKVKPTMKRAFETIRKLEPRKWQDRKTIRKHGRRRNVTGYEKKAVAPSVTAPRKKSIKIHEGITVKEFAELVGQKLPEIIKKFMELGMMATINQPVDMDAALLVADSLGVKVDIVSAETDLDVVEESAVPENLVPRPPVVTIMGHVDHGKTSLLDVIRQTRVTESEAGGITQHIGAYMVNIKGKDIAFLDTPGHEAFTLMRARGAKVTDIVILVVAADDGVMPQTIEAIDHSKAAGVTMVVAINKIDKPEANPQKIRTELSEYGIVPEDWGGENIMVEVSAKQKTGIDELLEMILLQAEMLELKADPDMPARGAIIESKLDRGRGPVATVLVGAGTLKVGDAFVAGHTFGKVRALINDMGKRVSESGPSVPVEVIGFSEVPQAGDTLVVIDDEKKARQIAITRQHKDRLARIARERKVRLEEVHTRIKEGEIKELNIIIKADVQGSAEAITDAFEGIVHPDVKVKVIHNAVGGINESDVMLAAASNAIIIGFNVRPEMKAAQVAESEGVDIKLYNVIYEAIEDVKKALEGLLEPTLKETVLGRAEVRDLFTISRIGTIAGCHVIDGVIKRNSDGIRVVRDSIVIYEGKIESLKRFKEDVGEVQSGYECGILIENFNDVKVGDILENYIVEKIATKLEH